MRYIMSRDLSAFASGPVAWVGVSLGALLTRAPCTRGGAGGGPGPVGYSGGYAL